jgi:SAM-dependent methyltransferase
MPPVAEPLTSNFEKYQTGNPVMLRIIDRFMTRVVDRIRELEPTQLVDVGCGEGFLAERVAHLPGVEAYRGIEINPDALALARSRLPELDFREGNILEEAEDKWADAAVCLEVLEHLDDPRTAVRYFRTGNLLRGKYLPTLGNHPEHVQQFRPASFQRLLRTGFEVVEIDTCFPWIIGICARPRF